MQVIYGSLIVMMLCLAGCGQCDEYEAYDGTKCGFITRSYCGWTLDGCENNRIYWCQRVPFKK